MQEPRKDARKSWSLGMSAANDCWGDINADVQKLIGAIIGMLLNHK